MKYRKLAGEFAGIFTLLALALLALPGSASEATEPNRWLEVRSPHFVVISNASEEQARSVSGQFERVRALLRRLLTNARVDPRDPVVVLAVDNERGLREVLPQFWERKGQRPVAGYWQGPHRHNVVLRVDAPDRERYRRALHEYVHMLTHANVPGLPAWLDEGISELWSTAAVRSDGVDIGRPALHHVKALRARRSWIPLDELLAMARAPDARDSEKLSMFYAQSWALTHYVMLGDSATDLPPAAGAAGAPIMELAPSKYVERLRDRANPVEAAALEFGELSQLERALTAYVHTGRFLTLRVEIPQPEIASANQSGDPTLRIRALSTAQSLAVRARFLVDGERPAAALPLLKEALVADPGETSALETLGYFHFRQNNAVEAARWFDRAIESGEASYLAYFYRAVLAGQVPYRVRGSEVRLKPDTTDGTDTEVRLKPDTTYGTDTTLVRAEDYLRRAIELNPGFAEAYARLADLYAWESGRLEEALPLMRRATEIEPDNAGYWLSLGKLLIGANRPDEARDAGQRGLAVATRSASSRELLEAFLSGLKR